MKEIFRLILSCLLTMISWAVWNGISEIKLPFWPFLWAACIIPIAGALIIATIATIAGE